MKFFFMCTSVASYVAFVLSLFIPHLSFLGASGRLCFVIVGFPEYLHIYVFDREILDWSLNKFSTIRSRAVPLLQFLSTNGIIPAGTQR